MSHFPSDTYRLGAANRDPEEEALGWVVRLNSGDVTDEDRAEFEIWRVDPENGLSYGRACKLWSGLGPILQSQEDAGWPDAVEEAPRRRLPRWRLSRASGGLAAAASILMIATGTIQYARVWQYDHVSGAGLMDRVALPDGSRVVMGPGTAISTMFDNGARRVSLARGEAFFDVRHDANHPFVVSSGAGVVRVVGTAFTIRRQGDGRVTVTVARGQVQVTSGARSVLLSPDRQASYGTIGLSSVRAANASMATAWMRGRLILENRPLGEVLEELDRYRGGKILLLNNEAARRRLSVVIDLTQTDNWLSALSASQGLRLTTAGPLTILR